MAVADAATHVLSFDGDRELVTEARAHDLLRAYEAVRVAPHPPSFTHITLRNKSYTLEAARVIASFFTELHDKRALAALTSVDFADMIAGRPEEEALQVLATLCEALRPVKTLTRIDLSDNALGEKGVRACFGLLLDQRELQHVYFCNNGISAAAARVIAEEVLLFRGLDEPTKLETFHFYNNMSGDGGAEALAMLLPRCPLLRDLRFSATRAQRAGSLAFARAMQCLHGLERLDLSDNTFAEAGGAAIAAAVAQMPHLVALNVRDTAIQDEGMIALAEALRSGGGGGSLTTLDVSGNELTASSMTELARVLRGMTSLRVLKLEDNELGSRGARALARVLQSALPCLETVVANVNEIGTSGALALVTATVAKPSLQSLELDGNMISAEGVVQMMALLESKGKSDILGSLEDNDEDGEEEGEEEEDEEEEDDKDEKVLPPPAPVDAMVDDLTAQLQGSLTIAKKEDVTALFAFANTQREVVDDARARQLLLDAGVNPDEKTALRFRAISLRGKSYTETGARVIADSFLSRLSVNCLQVVDLADVIAGRHEDEALRVLTCMSEALRGHTLEEIDLSDNALGEKGVRACFALLIPQPTLRRLLFCNNGISAAAATVIAQEIMLQNGASAACSLEEFHFYNNMSGHEGALAVANVLPQCGQLRVFRYASARAGLDASATMAAHIGQHLRHLTSLDLSDCSFEDDGVDALAKAVGAQTGLRSLKLRDASLAKDGAVRVLKAVVASGIQLESLDLSGNELEDDGLCGIVPLLESQKALRVLRLDENEITSSGLRTFASLMAQQDASPLTQLTELSLCGNEITAKGAIAVVETLLPLTPQLSKLELDSNMISDKGVATVTSLLAKMGKNDVLGSLQENDGDDESDDDE